MATGDAAAINALWRTRGIKFPVLPVSSSGQNRVRKYLIRWWFTPNWESMCYERAIILWNGADVARERLELFS